MAIETGSAQLEPVPRPECGPCDIAARARTSGRARGDAGTVRWANDLIRTHPHFRGTECVEIDVEAARRGLNRAMSMRLNTSTRAAIDDTTRWLVSLLRDLLRAALAADADEDDTVLALVRLALRHLDGQPARGAIAVEAWGYMQDSVTCAAALLRVHERRSTTRAGVW